MKTLSYTLGSIEEIVIGQEYYFGQLWDGEGDGEELLKSGSIGIDEMVIEFKQLDEEEDIMRTWVRVTDIY